MRVFLNINISELILCIFMCFSMFSCLNYKLTVYRNMCFMHEFTYTWTPVIAFRCVCVCVHEGVLSNRRYRDRWLRCPPLPCLSTAHAGVLRRSLRVCSVAGVFLPACVCRGSVLRSAATGIGAAAPDGIRERSASRPNSRDSLGNTRLCFFTEVLN